MRRRMPGRRRAGRAPAKLIATRKLLGLAPYGEISLTNLAGRLGVSPQAVNQWRVVPLSRVRQVEEITGIPRHKLRPDYFDPPSNTKSPPISSST